MFLLEKMTTCYFTYLCLFTKYNLSLNIHFFHTFANIQWPIKILTGDEFSIAPKISIVSTKINYCSVHKLYIFSTTDSKDIYIGFKFYNIINRTSIRYKIVALKMCKLYLPLSTYRIIYVQVINIYLTQYTACFLRLQLWNRHNLIFYQICQRFSERYDFHSFKIKKIIMDWDKGWICKY